MKRTTIMLPADLKARAMHAAREHGVSFGEFLRRALDDALRARGGTYDDPVFADAAVFEGPAPANLSDEHDDHLYGATE